MDTRNRNKVASSLAAVAVAGLALTTTASAALVVTFQGGNHAAGTVTSTHTNLASGSPTDSQTAIGNWGSDPIVLSGSLAGVTDSDEFKFTVAGYVTSSLSGNDLTVSVMNNFTKNAINGWGVLQGDIEADDALTYLFDLTGLPANTGLKITAVTGSNTGTSGQDIQVVVDNSSVTNLGGLSATGLDIAVTDGDLVAFRNNGGSDYRLKTFTLETFTIPEPSAFALFGLGGLGLALRRRR